MLGLVIKNTGSQYIVKVDGGNLIDCRIKGNFRLKGIRSTNPVAVGDRVVLTEPTDDGIAYMICVVAALEAMMSTNHDLMDGSELQNTAILIGR